MKEEQLTKVIMSLKTPNSSPTKYTEADTVPRPSPTWFIQKLDKYFKDDTRRYWQTEHKSADQLFQKQVELNTPIYVEVNGNMVPIPAQEYQNTIINQVNHVF